MAAAASLKRMLEQVGIEVRAAKAFPEDKEMLKTVLCKLADAGMAELVLTTGAVGFLEKHCAPDAVRETADRLLPGIPEALRAYNLRHTKKVILDRSEAGIRKKTLMINPVSYTHLRAHETDSYLVCRLLLEKKKNQLAHSNGCA